MFTLKDGYIEHKNKIKFLANTALAIGIPALLGAPILPVITGIFCAGLYQAVSNVVMKYTLLRPMTDEVKKEDLDKNFFSQYFVEPLFYEIKNPDLKESFKHFAKGEEGSTEGLTKALAKREKEVYAALLAELRNRLEKRLNSISDDLKAKDSLKALAAQFKSGGGELLSNNAILLEAMEALKEPNISLASIRRIVKFLKLQTSNEYGAADADVLKLSKDLESLLEKELTIKSLKANDLCNQLSAKVLARLANVEELNSVNEMLPQLLKAVRENNDDDIRKAREVIKARLDEKHGTYSPEEVKVLTDAIDAYAGIGHYADRIANLATVLSHKTEEGFGNKDANSKGLLEFCGKFLKDECTDEELVVDVQGNSLVPLLESVAKFEEDKRKIEERVKLFSSFKAISFAVYALLSFSFNRAVYKDLLSAAGSKTFEFSLGNFSFGSYLPKLITAQKIPMFQFDSTLLGFGKLLLTTVATTAYNFAGTSLSKLLTPSDSQEKYVGSVQSSMVVNLIANGLEQGFAK